MSEDGEGDQAKQGKTGTGPFSHILDREDSLLEEERKRLRHAEQLKEIIAGTYDTLYEKEDSIISELSLCVKGVEKGSEIDRRLESVGNALASAKAELEETALHLRQLRDSVVISPYRLEEVEERLHSLNSLKKKYGPSLENVMAFREELSGMIHNLDRQEKELEDIKKDLKKQEKDTVSRATALSLKRREIAEKMEKSVEGELALLEMGGTRFEVRFAPKDPEDINDPETLINSVRPEGYDRVEFMLSPNVGEELRPLSKIASGGELSRIMLALKTILARKASVETIIFDEVDSGIGGATAEVVGEKLNSLAQYHQILCITHLPQIASKGDTHFLVTKTVRGNRTETLITALSRDQRVKEVGRLMGGKVVSDQAIALAREMLGKHI